MYLIRKVHVLDYYMGTSRSWWHGRVASFMRHVWDTLLDVIISGVSCHGVHIIRVYYMWCVIPRMPRGTKSASGGKYEDSLISKMPWHTVITKYGLFCFIYLPICDSWFQEGLTENYYLIRERSTGRIVFIPNCFICRRAPGVGNLSTKLLDLVIRLYTSFI